MNKAKREQVLSEDVELYLMAWYAVNGVVRDKLGVVEEKYDI